LTSRKKKNSSLNRKKIAKDLKRKLMRLTTNSSCIRKEISLPRFSSTVHTELWDVKVQSCITKQLRLVPLTSVDTC
jgi:hypothetical protein